MLLQLWLQQLMEIVIIIITKFDNSNNEESKKKKEIFNVVGVIIVEDGEVN